ncbi:troponin I, slow skeletal muscle [Callorhinchus milii]|uniref:Slow troponin I n=2 Tax=Callorhinchus milii TaxID=7868 RepID=V9LAL7_CALMI|nr:troponin I, slow skeletal muscle [Callorhinchus milii]|eukprot:gi/632971787/ref/XP_007902345.1/ PREDICTED: troponin I, slow skeletal muscle-like [Callorhinchus milii]
MSSGNTGRKKKVTIAQKIRMKTALLAYASKALAKEKLDRENEKNKTIEQNVPGLSMTKLSTEELQGLCKTFQEKIDNTESERYDIQSKVTKNDSEIDALTQTICELKGKFKRPSLRRVRVSADEMLGALAENTCKTSMDLRSNLKSVRKEDEKDYKSVEVTDWRKNVEEMSGMKGRKKIFDTFSGNQ